MPSSPLDKRGPLRKGSVFISYSTMLYADGKAGAIYG